MPVYHRWNNNRVWISTHRSGQKHSAGSGRQALQVCQQGQDGSQWSLQFSHPHPTQTLDSCGDGTHQLAQSLLRERLLLSALYCVGCGGGYGRNQSGLWSKEQCPGLALPKTGWGYVLLDTCHLCQSQSPLGTYPAALMWPENSNRVPAHSTWPSFLPQCLAAELTETPSK